ncbi:hypothetical protein [Blastococcus montanus]|uniref:hypothetical protein n=1 Tax=Blastococcus montanus TaxID=3144973 RepID=UPI003209D31C
MSTTTPDRPTTRRPWLLTVTRGVLALFGAFKLYGTAYFTFFATTEQGGVQTPGDWVVAGWSAALAIAFLLTAVRLGRDRWVLPVLGTVLLLDLAFSLVKLTVYGENEAVGFLAVDLVVLVLLGLLSRRSGGRAA